MTSEVSWAEIEYISKFSGTTSAEDAITLMRRKVFILFFVSFKHLRIKKSSSWTSYLSIKSNDIWSLLSRNWLHLKILRNHFCKRCNNWWEEKSSSSSLSALNTCELKKSHLGLLIFRWILMNSEVRSFLWIIIYLLVRNSLHVNILRNNSCRNYNNTGSKEACETLFFSSS